MRHRYLTADVFTDRPFGGNPLAVFPDARNIPPGRMQQVARELNLSETVFVLPPDDPAHTRKLRIFTPGQELPFAGHPTVGTAHVLAALEEIPLVEPATRIVFEEGVGPVPVTIRVQRGVPVFAQLTAARLPEQGPPAPPAADLAALLSLDPDDVLDGEDRAETWSCGVGFLFVPVQSRAALGRVRLRQDLWETMLAGSWAPHLFVLCREPELPGSALRARMFAPAMGIAEDPATGGACSALGGWIAARAKERQGTLRLVVEQGFEMGRPSLLHLEVDLQEGTPTAVRVGGATVLMSQGWMEAGE
ncbi:MAG TPA: hypothetical protein DD490_04665 [Acidobacteria bacterium]|nr:hypothetical protein [Acidobacteriota bacterium]